MPTNLADTQAAVQPGYCYAPASAAGQRTGNVVIDVRTPAAQAGETQPAVGGTTGPQVAAERDRRCPRHATRFQVTI